MDKDYVSAVEDEVFEREIELTENTTDIGGTVGEDLAAAIMIKVYPGGHWSIFNALNDDSLNQQALHDLFSEIVEGLGSELMAEKVMAKIQRKLAGGF